MEHRTIYPASPSGTHPSFRSSGLKEFTCECGATVRYTECVSDYYSYNGTRVGYFDGDEDMCLECMHKAFDE